MIKFGNLFIPFLVTNAALSTTSTPMEISKQRKNKNGYMQVNLTQRIGRKRTVTVTVHKLVALAFLKPPLTMPGRAKACSRVAHVDGHKYNNSASNLKWTKIEESCNSKNG